MVPPNKNDLNDEVKETLDELALFLHQKRAKNLNCDLNVTSVRSFTEQLEKNTKLKLYEVARRAGCRDVTEFFNMYNIERDSYGYLVLPPRKKVSRSPAGFFIHQGVKEKALKLKKQNDKKHFAQVQATVSYIEKPQPSKWEDPNPVVPNEMQEIEENVAKSNLNVHLYGGNVEELQDGMLVKIANGTIHYIPHLPVFDRHNKETVTIGKQSRANHKHLIKEIHRQHKMAEANPSHV